MKRFALPIILSILLTACGYSPSSVKVVDVYDGKKIQVLEKLTEEDQKLYRKFVARKVMQIAYVLPNGEIYDQSGKIWDTSSFNSWAKDSNVTQKEFGKFIMFTKNFPNSNISLKETFGKITVEEAINNQRDFEKNESLNAIKTVEDTVKLSNEIAKVISIDFIKKTTEPTIKWSDNAVNRIIDLDFEFTNNSDKKVEGFIFIATFKDMFNEELLKTRLRYEDGIEPNSKVSYPAELELNLNKNHNRRFLQNELSKMSVEYSFEKIVYENDIKKDKPSDITNEQVNADESAKNITQDVKEKAVGAI